MSGHFSAPLDSFVWIDGVRWQLVTGFRYYLTDNEAGEFVDVPGGFTTNFASIPRSLRAIFSPTDKDYAQIAIVHDKLFLAPVIRTAHSARPCLFEETPGIFLHGSETLGAGWVKRRVKYRMLQGFSRGAWDAYREQDKIPAPHVALTPRELARFEARAVEDRLVYPLLGNA
jgi:hypothetical protein